MSYRWKPLRKKTFVNTRIQGRILGRILIYWLLYHFLLWNGLFVFRFAQYRSAITSGAEIVPFRQVYAQFCVDFYPLLICAVVILPAFLFDFVGMTHRIAGPLVRFQTALRKLIAGERVESVEIRKRDLLVEFQKEFNEFLHFYNARLDKEASAEVRTCPGETSLIDEDLAGDRPSSQRADLGETAVMLNM